MIDEIVEAIRNLCAYHKVWIDGRDGFVIELSDKRIEILRADSDEVIGNVFTRAACERISLAKDK